MDKGTQNLLQSILKTGKIIDIDFSKWDQEISVIIQAALLVDSPVGNTSCFLVEFQKTLLFECQFFHHKFPLEDISHHFQWNLADFKLQRKGNGWYIVLQGYTHFPNLQIECEEIVIRPFPDSILNRLFPGWDKPYQPFVRPGIFTLAERFLEKKKGK